MKQASDTRQRFHKEALRTSGLGFWDLFGSVWMGVEGLKLSVKWVRKTLD